MKTLRVGVAGLWVLAGIGLSGVSAAQMADPDPSPSRVRDDEEESARDGGRDAGDREERGERRGRGDDVDGARFRGGIRAEVGALIAPGPGEVLPGVGAQGNIGVQINDLIGVYWAPSLDILFGSLGGLNLGSAVLVDFTFDDTWQIGVGPDVGAFAALGSSGATGTAAGGAVYGGRLHFAGFPLVGEGENPVRRKGLALGIDVRFLVGDVGFATVGPAGTTGSASEFLLVPMGFIGYEAF